MRNFAPIALLLVAACGSKPPQRVLAATCGAEGVVEKGAWEPRQCARTIEDFIQKNPRATVENFSLIEQGGYASAIILYRGELTK